MDARSAAVDFRSRRGRPGASPHKPSAALPNATFSGLRIWVRALVVTKTKTTHDLDVAVGILRHDGYQRRGPVAFQNGACRTDDGISTTEIEPCHTLAALKNECLRQVDG